MIASIRATLHDPDWAVGLALGVAALGVLAGLLAHAILFRILERVTRGSESRSDNIVVRELKRPTRYAMAALGLVLAAREMAVLIEAWQRIAAFVMPALIGWMALAVMRGVVRAMALKADVTQPDNLSARRRQTRLAIFSRIGTFIIVFITVGLMLLSIPGVRDIGVTLVASAGLAGLAVGAAAQPALKSLIAGIQMALTEPINIDDLVVIDGQGGRIEDIHTTYVVVRTWDERRLIVPTVKFLEDTFENWTRTSSQLLAPAFLRLDPLADIAPIRAEFLRQLEASELWDRRVSGLHVTDMDAQSIQVRMLASAADSGRVFDLQCALREGMLAWIRENQPQAIARQRVDAPEAAGVDADVGA